MLKRALCFPCTVERCALAVGEGAGPRIDGMDKVGALLETGGCSKCEIQWVVVIKALLNLGGLRERE